MEKESVRSVAIQYVKLMAGLALVLFNLWHLAKSQADKQNSDELQLLRAEFAELKNDATMGPDAAALVTDLYFDGVHPTSTGQANIAAIATPVLNAL